MERAAKKILQILVIKILSQRKLPNPSPRLKLNGLSLSQYINNSMANYHISVAQFSVSVSVLLTMDFTFSKVTFYCCCLSF